MSAFQGEDTLPALDHKKFAWSVLNPTLRQCAFKERVDQTGMKSIQGNISDILKPQIPPVANLQPVLSQGLNSGEVIYLRLEGDHV
jgi:hypothetical protein